MKLSVIIPVYNEQRTVTELIDKVLAVKLKGISKEIIVVDDGSTDDSSLLIAKKLKTNPSLTTLALPINLGKGAAIRLGLKHASGDIIIIQDADLELDPEEYQRLLNPIINKKTAIVYGSRVIAPTGPIPLRSRLFTFVSSGLTSLLFGRRLTDINTAYKAFTKKVRNQINLRSVSFEFEAEFTVKALKQGFKIIEVPVSYRPRTDSEGKKIRFRDGLDILFTIIKYRLFND
jgi:glycosyltransferase involved in cell wall biosynthesis